MRKSRFTDAQIVAILQEADRTRKTGDVIRRYGISCETFYRWRRGYGGLQVSEDQAAPRTGGREPSAQAHRGRPGAQSPGAEGRLGKRALTMAERRAIVGEILPTAGSERRACRWLGFHRSAVRYVPDLRDDTALRTRLRQIAEAQPGLGARFTLGSADTGFPRRLPSDLRQGVEVGSTF